MRSQWLDGLTAHPVVSKKTLCFLTRLPLRGQCGVLTRFPRKTLSKCLRSQIAALRAAQNPHLYPIGSGFCAACALRFIPLDNLFSVSRAHVSRRAGLSQLPCGK